MHRRTRRLPGLIAIAASSLLIISACAGGDGDDGDGDAPQASGGYADCAQNLDTCNSGERKAGGTFTVGLGKVIPTFSIYSSDGNTVETVMVTNTYAPNPTIFLPSGKLVYNPDVLAEDPKITSEAPQTVVYKIRPEAKWDDGTEISADDFNFIWKVNNGKDCPECSPADDTGYKSITSVTGSDNGKTVTMVFSEPYPDWKGLFQPLIPAHVAKKAGDISTPAGLATGFKVFEGQPTYSGGPYKVSAYEKDVKVELVPNPKWYGKEKPTLEKLVFRLFTDQTQMIPALQNKELNGLNAQPNQAMVDSLKNLAGQGVQFEMTAGRVWEHIDLNMKNPFLAELALRQAIFTAISTQEIIDKTLSFFPDAKQIGGHNILPGEPGYEDIRAKVAPDQGTGNVEKAKKILADAGYTVDGGVLKNKAGTAIPELRFRYTDGVQTRADTAVLIQAKMKELGLNIKIDPTKDLGGTLDNYDYELIIFAWAGNPLVTPQRGLWHSQANNNKVGYADPESDRLLDEMVKTLDDTKARQLLNQQDEIMTKAAVVLPLFAKPNLMVTYNEFINIRDNNKGGYFTYNCQEWGLKA